LGSSVNALRTKSPICESVKKPRLHVVL
jgi:hypothetical protein